MKTIFIILGAIICIGLLLFIFLQVFFALAKKWRDEDVV